MTDSMIEKSLTGMLAESHRGVLATLKRDGRPHLTNVVHAFTPATRLIRVSVTDDRIKTRNLRRDPRASYHVMGSDFWHFVVADVTAELSAVAGAPDDATVDELVELYQAIGGEHPNWDEYRAVMVSERRVVARLHVEHMYGKA